MYIENKNMLARSICWYSSVSKMAVLLGRSDINRLSHQRDRRLDLVAMADHLATVLVQQGPDLTGVEPSEQDHGGQHQTSIEHVQEPFVRDEVSVVALAVLDQAEDRSDQNERTTAVESVEMFLPRVVADHAAAGGYLVHAHVESDADDDEEAKEQNLDDQTADGDVFAVLECFDCTRRHDATASGLETERDDIANDEDLCEPFLRDDAVLFSVGEENDTSKFHVDASGEQSRGNENQDGLDGVCGDAEVWSFLGRFGTLDERHELM